jgi:diacylglycerol kinase (ATP)
VTSALQPEPQDSPLKGPAGIARIGKAFLNSCNGLRDGWSERAFRLELLLAAVLVPTALLVPVSLVERVLLVGSVMLVLVVELLNSSVEAAIDRVSLERHPLSRRAKDLASAAVLLSLLLCLFVWGSLLLPLVAR